jgi:hypothetical protein
MLKAGIRRRVMLNLMWSRDVSEFRGAGKLQAPMPPRDLLKEAGR